MTVMAFVAQEDNKSGAIQRAVESPYEVPVRSVVTVPAEGPLMPFEERQLQNLIQQVEAAPPRIREAFYVRIGLR